MKKVVPSQGVEDFTDTRVAYVIVEADSHVNRSRSSPSSLTRR